MYKIREVFQNDCDGIGIVYCDSWKTAYQNLLPQTYLDLLTVEDCTPDKVSERDVVLCIGGCILERVGVIRLSCVIRITWLQKMSDMRSGKLLRIMQSN